MTVLAAQATPDKHVVQLYREDARLLDSVAAWLRHSLDQGGPALVICTPDHAAGLRDRLGASASRMHVLDASETLAAFMADGMPNGARFKRLVRATLAGVRPDVRAPVRAWGEMVNILWQEQRYAAAQRLEALWNEAIEEHDIELLCSYRLDRDAPETYAALEGVCRGHSQLHGEHDHDAFEGAVSRTLVRLVGDEGATRLRALLEGKHRVPIGMRPAQSIIVALHDLNPALTREILAEVKRELSAA